MLIQSIRNLIEQRTTNGVAQALRKLWLELKTQNCHRQAVKDARKYRDLVDLRLNIGCGPNLKPGWINIDLGGQPDLQLDLREALPFADGSVAIIYSEHFFEHLEYPKEALGFLQESLRVLKSGGIFSVGVPDCEWPVVSYSSGDNQWFEVSRKRWHPDWCNTRMHNLNYLFRQTGDHKYAYDFETLSQVLEHAGFDQITRRDFDKQLDDEQRQWGTLYIDARKP